MLSTTAPLECRQQTTSGAYSGQSLECWQGYFGEEQAFSSMSHGVLIWLLRECSPQHSGSKDSEGLLIWPCSSAGGFQELPKESLPGL